MHKQNRTTFSQNHNANNLISRLRLRHKQNENSNYTKELKSTKEEKNEEHIAQYTPKAILLHSKRDESEDTHQTNSKSHPPARLIDFNLSEQKIPESKNRAASRESFPPVKREENRGVTPEHYKENPNPKSLLDYKITFNPKKEIEISIRSIIEKGKNVIIVHHSGAGSDDWIEENKESLDNNFNSNGSKNYKLIYRKSLRKPDTATADNERFCGGFEFKKGTPSPNKTQPKNSEIDVRM